MARDPADYVALALARNQEEEFSFAVRSQDFSGDLDQVRARAEELCGFSISHEILARVLRTLADCGLIRITEDAFSGTFVKVKASQLEKFFQRAMTDFAKAEQDYGDESSILANPSDYPAAAALFKHELFDDYRELGSEWLTRALAGLRDKIGPNGAIDDLLDRSTSSDAIPAPASDRIVTLGHNQQVELEAASVQLIDLVGKENSIDGDAGLRQRVVGELRAGLELIRAQTLRAYLLYSTMIEWARNVD